MFFIISELALKRAKCGRVGFYNPKNLEMAILAVTSRKMNQVQAAAKYGVTQSTISRRLSKIGFKKHHEALIEQTAATEQMEMDTDSKVSFEQTEMNIDSKN